jgi:hypothetical protein
MVMYLGKIVEAGEAMDHLPDTEAPLFAGTGFSGAYT